MEPASTSTPAAPVGQAPGVPAVEAQDPRAAAAADAPPITADPPGGADPGRRRFLRWLGGFAVVSTVAMVLTPIFGFLVPTNGGRAAGGGKTLVGTTSDIPPGSGKVVALGSKPAIVVNTQQGIKAYSAICTHLGCVVAYNDMIGVIQCPCHDGHFNPTTGAVVSGPPPAPLPPITVSVEGNQIYLTEA